MISVPHGSIVVVVGGTVVVDAAGAARARPSSRTTTRLGLFRSMDGRTFLTKYGSIQETHADVGMGTHLLSKLAISMISLRGRARVVVLR